MNLPIRFLAAFSGLTLLGTSLLANPTSKNPAPLLAIRATEDLPGDHIKHDYESLNKRWLEAKGICDEMWKKHGAKKLTLADARKVGPLVLLLRPLQRHAQYLKTHFEACGLDLEIRTNELERRLRIMIVEMLALPGVNTKALDEQLQKSHQAGMKRLPQIEALAKRGRFLQAEAELYEIVDDLERNAIWFPGVNLSHYYNPFKVPLTEATAARHQQLLQDLQAIVAAGPDFKALRTELTQAAKAIGANGQAMLNGQSLDGPQLLADWQQHALRRQAAAKRAQCALWALEQITNESQRPDEWSANQLKFAADEPALLAAIIQADAQRTKGPDAAALYQKYLPVAVALCAAGPAETLSPALDRALSALAAKAGNDQDLTAYKSATEPLLGWRRFMARSQAKSLAAASLPLADWCSKACSKPQVTETIIPLENGDINSASVVSSTELALEKVLAAGPSPPVVVGRVFAVNPAASRCVATYQRRVFALVGSPAQAKLQTAIAHLERQLLLPAQGQPPSLAAATALATARAGSFESVSGSVEMLTCEPLLTRFISMSDEAARLLPLGPLPPETSLEGQPGMWLTVRCDIPSLQWWQHECFVIKP